MPNFTVRNGKASGLLVAGIAALTLALVIGMKFVMSDDTAAVPAQPADSQQLFKEPAAGEGPRVQSPVSHSETSSGGGLDMFSKTNAGYYGADESTPTAAAKTEPEVAKSTAPAAKKAAAPKAAGTVIPRLKSSSFGAVAPKNVAPHGAGQSMPDISGMIQQAQEQATKKNP